MGFSPYSWEIVPTQSARTTSNQRSSLMLLWLMFLVVAIQRSLLKCFPSSHTWGESCGAPDSTHVLNVFCLLPFSIYIYSLCKIHYVIPSPDLRVDRVARAFCSLRDLYPSLEILHMHNLSQWICLMIQGDSFFLSISSEIIFAEEWTRYKCHPVKNIIPSGDRTQDLWIRSPTRYPLR